MNQKTIFKWSGICVVAGAVILSIGYLLRPYIEKQFIDEFAGTPVLISTIMVAAGTLTLLCGLPGILAAQIKQAGKGGLISGGISFAAIAAFHLGTLALYFVLPVLITANEATRQVVYSDIPPFPRFAMFWALSLLVQCIGLVWFAIKSWKANVYPRISSSLLMMGSLVFIAAPIINFRLIKPANTLIMIGFMIMGIALFRRYAFSGKEIMQETGQDKRIKYSNKLVHAE
jgi:hypothetical protein